jgi:hypothetical protein
MPERLQRKRLAGWRMPSRCVYVGRPTIFGNPFFGSESAGLNVARYRDLLEGRIRPVNLDRQAILAALKSLRGKDLACWCPLDQPCHADVLLELANR